MISGLSTDEFRFLQKNLIEPLKHAGARVFVFGSRATGKEKKFSDIDLLYIPKSEADLPSHEVYRLLSFIEDSNFPYKIDLVKDSELAQSYRHSVEREKIEL